MWEYKAKITDVYDGDTFTAYFDLGFYVYHVEKIRLVGVDTPEIRGEEKIDGLRVRDYVRGLILDKECVIQVHKKGKYGRWVSTVMLPDSDVSLSRHLVELGMAVEVDYD